MQKFILDLVEFIKQNPSFLFILYTKELSRDYVGSITQNNAAFQLNNGHKYINTFYDYPELSDIVNTDEKYEALCELNQILKDKHAEIKVLSKEDFDLFHDNLDNYFRSQKNTSQEPSSEYQSSEKTNTFWESQSIKINPLGIVDKFKATIKRLFSTSKKENEIELSSISAYKH